MMRSDAVNLHIYPVRVEMNGAKHIPILHVCSMNNNESKELFVDKNIISGLFYGEGRIKKQYRR